MKHAMPSAAFAIYQIHSFAEEKMKPKNNEENETKAKEKHK